MQDESDVGGGREAGDVELAIIRHTAPQSEDDQVSPLTISAPSFVMVPQSALGVAEDNPLKCTLLVPQTEGSSSLIAGEDAKVSQSEIFNNSLNSSVRYGGQALSEYDSSTAQHPLQPARPSDTCAAASHPYHTSRAAVDSEKKDGISMNVSVSDIVPPNSALQSLNNPVLCNLSSKAGSPTFPADLQLSQLSEGPPKEILSARGAVSKPFQTQKDIMRPGLRQDFLSKPASPSHHGALVPEENWRDAITRVCADMLGKSLKDLEHEFTALGMGHGDHAPRDLADYTIMSTLKSRDSFAMRNAPSWLFNTMDRSGAGFVLRDEFVRYAPFMSPMADSAIAGLVFDELIRAQVNAQAVEELDSPRRRSRDIRNKNVHQAGALSKTTDKKNKNWIDTVLTNKAYDSGSNAQPLPENRDKELYPISAALHYDTWKQYFDSVQQKYNTKDDDWDRVKKELGLDPSERLIKSQGAVDHSDIWPTLGKLYLSQRYLVFFAAVGRNHYVARLGAIARIGIKSLPLLMRDCISVELESETQAAMNGVSAPIKDQSIALENLSNSKSSTQHVVIEATRAAKHEKLARKSQLSGGDGTSMQAEPSSAGIITNTKQISSTGKLDDNAITENTNRHSERKGFRMRQDDIHSKNQERKSGKSQNVDATLPQHVWNVMKQFTAGGKPLVFSLIEFREATRRDHWMAIITEMAAAHRLHLKLGFGSSGRVAQNSWNGISDESALSPECLAIDEASFGATDSSPNRSSCDISKMTSGSHVVYLTSPFRNEPPPPLLAVAAHANIVRYRAVKLVPGSRNPSSLLVFSHPERQSGPIGWYVDAVRAHDNWAGRSWIERAMDAIRENMELNKRVYNVQDDEPFDVSRLGQGMGKLAQLCTPLVHAAQIFNHVVQWRNPPATILAFFLSMYILVAGWVPYLPAATFFILAATVVATKVDTFGLEIWLWGDGDDSDKTDPQPNVIEIVSQVHGTLHTTQNVIKQINLVLGKIRTLCLWRTDEEWKSWVAVGGIFCIGLFLYNASTNIIYSMSVLFLFAKHFLPPDNPIRRFWISIPADVTRLQHSDEKRTSESRKSR